ncbi:SRPBCC domain-containing protein [Nocardia camponoti]|uniref:SRPBCC domain-containing protein n=1 Tax=Nocardia camponoti TaxID=1616106 RepID=A0A917QCN4_9NOCA|nr:SRPBCC domain-containing protein [Nocardia camponoti]GGK43899.1 hypothetical protein GCM10011591_14360 [Nocardia camponoti]
MALVIDATVEIDAPAERVWQVLTDFARYGEWNPFCVEASSSLELGSPIDMRVDLGGKELRKQREYIASCTPGVEFSYRMRPVPLGALSSLRSHTLIGLPNGRCRYESRFRVSGWLSPIVARSYGEALRKGFAGMTDAVVKRACEGI